MGNVKRSPWLLHYDGSSCNGCDIEVLACLTPVYDAERFGIINTGDPMQADIFLITGGINKANQAVVKQLYDQMPRPKVVVAVGVCACTGGVFKECYNIIGGADTTIPVDIYVPGCAARPQAIIDGIVKAVELFQQRADEMDAKDKEKKLAAKEAKKAAKVAEAEAKAQAKAEAEAEKAEATKTAEVAEEVTEPVAEEVTETAEDVVVAGEEQNNGN